MSLTRPAHERTLRILIMWDIVPAFPLILASGITNANRRWGWDYYFQSTLEKCIILFGFIPLFLTLVSGLVYLRTEKKPTRGAFQATVWFIVDAAIAVAYLTILIFIWAKEPNRLREQGDYLMLETYGSCFLIANWATHMYFTIYPFIRAIHNFVGRDTCPHCGNTTSLRFGGQVPRESMDEFRYGLLAEDQYRDSQENNERVREESQPGAAGPSKVTAATGDQLISDV